VPKGPKSGLVQGLPLGRKLSQFFGRVNLNYVRLFNFPGKTEVFPAPFGLVPAKKLGQFSALLNLGRPWTSPDFGPFGTECGGTQYVTTLHRGTEARTSM
jgi:hypothetical protein